MRFKSDESFLRKLAVGAAGTNATMARLSELGFNPIELERGSSGFKIWKKIKIKRIRVPDILCLDTGLRFESRGKTKLEISMSHSLNDPGRAWDAGMRDDDWVSITLLRQLGDSFVELTPASPVHFARVEDMRKAFAESRVNISKPKGAEEGSEIRIVWTSAAAQQRSTVLAVDPQRILLSPEPEGRQRSIRLERRSGAATLLPQVEVGNVVEANQIVASVVPVLTELEPPSPVDEDYFIDRLASVSLGERYAAAKALRFRGYSKARHALESRVNDPDEYIYIQLEAAAALAAHGHSAGWEFIESRIHSSTMIVPLEAQLEAVIVASEIPAERSEALLKEVLHDTGRADELRAGAAWGLGQFTSSSSATALTDAFNSTPLAVKIEAARALLRIAEPQVSRLVELLKNADATKRDGIAWALARTGRFNPAEAALGADDNLRRWISYIVGYGKDNFVEAEVEEICKEDSEVYFAASVLWQILGSWVYELREY